MIFSFFTCRKFHTRHGGEPAQQERTNPCQRAALNPSRHLQYKKRNTTSSHFVPDDLSFSAKGFSSGIAARLAKVVWISSCPAIFTTLLPACLDQTFGRGMRPAAWPGDCQIR